MSKLRKNTSREPAGCPEGGQFMSNEQQQREAQQVREGVDIEFHDPNWNHVQIHVPPASDAAPGEVQMALIVTSHAIDGSGEFELVTTFETVPVQRL